MAHQGVAPFSDAPIGTFTFKRLENPTFVYLPVVRGESVHWGEEKPGFYQKPGL